MAGFRGAFIRGSDLDFRVECAATLCQMGAKKRSPYHYVQVLSDPKILYDFGIRNSQDSPGMRRSRRPDFT